MVRQRGNHNRHPLMKPELVPASRSIRSMSLNHPSVGAGGTVVPESKSYDQNRSFLPHKVFQSHVASPRSYTSIYRPSCAAQTHFINVSRSLVLK